MGGTISRTVEASFRKVSSMTPIEDAAAIVSAAMYGVKGNPEEMPRVLEGTPVGDLRLESRYRSKLRGWCAGLYVGANHTILGFRGSTDAADWLLCDVAVLVGGSTAHKPWREVVSGVLREARGRGHELILTGHSLGGVQAAANFACFFQHRDVRLEVFNCGSGLTNIAIGQMLPVDGFAQLAALFKRNPDSFRATHHHIIGDPISGGSPIVAVTKTYHQTKCCVHAIRNFLATAWWDKLNI